MAVLAHVRNPLLLFLLLLLLKLVGAVVVLYAMWVNNEGKLFTAWIYIARQSLRRVSFRVCIHTRLSWVQEWGFLKTNNKMKWTVYCLLVLYGPLLENAPSFPRRKQFWHFPLLLYIIIGGNSFRNLYLSEFNLTRWSWKFDMHYKNRRTVSLKLRWIKIRILSQIPIIPIVHYSFVSPPFSSLTDKVAPLSNAVLLF